MGVGQGARGAARADVEILEVDVKGCCTTPVLNTLELRDSK